MADEREPLSTPPRGVAPVWYRLTTHRLPWWARPPLTLAALGVSVLLTWGFHVVEPDTDFHGVNLAVVLVVATLMGRDPALFVAIVGTLITDYAFDATTGRVLTTATGWFRVALHAAISLFAASLVGALREALSVIDAYRREADDLTRLQRNVMAVVTHDLRNPILGVDLQATRLERLAARGDPPAGTVTDAARTIRAGAEQMRRIVADLHDALRIELGLFALEPREREPAELVRRVGELLGPVAEAEGVSLVALADDGLPTVRCDRLEQALGNLVHNAVKFSARGTTVTVEARHAPGGVAFVVADQGPGIAPADLPHLFERYWRGAEKRARGTGLGLFITAGIVRSNGGTIGVASELGRGTTFTITLPEATATAG